jgi:hypothetical protein
MSYQTQCGLSVDDQKEVLPPSVMRCFDRTEPRVVQQGTLPTPGKRPYAGNTFCVNQIARNSQMQRRPGWGPGLLNSAWWEHAQCVGELKVRGWGVRMKDQKRIPKCRRTGAATASHALLHMLQGWPRMQKSTGCDISPPNNAALSQQILSACRKEHGCVGSVGRER